MNPTTNNAGAVAKLGMARNMGANKMAETNRPAAVMAVRPVRAPTATPAALSTYVVVVEVPRMAPTDVAIASAERALEARGSVPSLAMNPPLNDTPINVPSVSKKSTKKKASKQIKTISRRSDDYIKRKWTFCLDHRRKHMQKLHVMLWLFKADNTLSRQASSFRTSSFL